MGVAPQLAAVESTQTDGNGNENVDSEVVPPLAAAESIQTDSVALVETIQTDDFETIQTDDFRKLYGNPSVWESC